ncbi:MAG: SDR family NAD(P)-dependent oxidoreductase, partial [Planctomycetes bacterium]|nr:SDR family NAD(P)-dependent oxidoreductase [Planctomycetota bacterium]
MKKAIVVGATSGIGRGLALLLARNGYDVCVTGRRESLLDELLKELPGNPISRRMDVTDADASIAVFNEIVAEMGRVDLVVISAGTGFIDPELPWDNDRQTIETNVTGFTALANAAWHQFMRQESGHLVGISSIAAERGGGAAA